MMQAGLAKSALELRRKKRVCPSCGREGTMRKQFAPPAIHYKGSGWAKKDRGSSSSGTKASKSSTSDGGSDGRSSSDSSSSSSSSSASGSGSSGAGSGD